MVRSRHLEREYLDFCDHCRAQSLINHQYRTVPVGRSESAFAVNEDLSDRTSGTVEGVCADIVTIGRDVNPQVLSSNDDITLPGGAFTLNNDHAVRLNDRLFRYQDTIHVEKNGIQ